tara:strand:- start:1027 stop:1158 length:132 start_codon:yes stop_codon:yes gene_type:complete
MPIYNEVFDTYRMKVEKIENAIKLLEKNGYLVYNKDKEHATNL